jgi:F-type H+-transporting ATPase subunit c
MEIEAAKQIGAGIAAIALAGAGKIAGEDRTDTNAGALRNPSAAASQFTTLLIGFALTEFTGLLGFVVAMIILFG